MFRGYNILTLGRNGVRLFKILTSTFLALLENSIETEVFRHCQLNVHEDKAKSKRLPIILSFVNSKKFLHIIN